MSLFSTFSLRPFLRAVSTTRPISTQPRPPFPPARRRFEHALPLPSIPTASPLAPPHNPNPTPNARPKPGNADRRPTNHHIPFSHVYVIDASGKRSPTKHRLASLLAAQGDARGPDRRVLELVASTPDPIVRVTTRAEVAARDREMRQARRRGKVGEAAKEVQLVWGVAWADVEHKLRKARRDLEKGYRVVVVVTVKKGQRPSSRQEWVSFADEIAEAFGGVGKEWKGREITPRTMTLSFQRVGVEDDVS